MKTNKDTRHYEGKDLESMAAADNYYNWIVKEFGEYIKGVVVEVGAGAGTFSEYILKRKPKQLYVFEPTAEMAPVLKKNLSKYKNVTVINDFLGAKKTLLKNKVDNVFYINVLEHVEDDQKELKIVFDILKPGGHLCVYVPALPRLHGSFDEQVGHYRRYVKKDVKAKLESAGFEVKRVNYSDIVGIVPWFVNFKILKRRRLDSKAVATYDKLVIPAIRFQEKIVKPPIGKNIWAIAKKPE